MGGCWAHPVQFQCSLSHSGQILGISPTFPLMPVFPSGASVSSLPLVSTQTPGQGLCLCLSPFSPEGSWPRCFPGAFGLGAGSHSHSRALALPSLRACSGPSRPGMCLWGLSQPWLYPSPVCPRRDHPQGSGIIPRALGSFLPLGMSLLLWDGVRGGLSHPSSPKLCASKPALILNPCPSLECLQRVCPIFWLLAGGFGAFRCFFAGTGVSGTSCPAEILRGTGSARASLNIPENPGWTGS